MGRGRAPCCDKTKVRTGPWTPEEDLRLMNFIQKHGHSNWRALPKQAGLLRCGKSCRLRWINYLRPDVKRGNFTPEEENAIIELHNSFGNKWSKIASCLPGRTDNEIKNVWNTHLKKRLVTKKSTMDCHKTQGNDSKMDYSSASSSSSTTTSTDEKIRGDDQGVHETQVKKPDEQPDFLKENSFSDSPSSSCVSNFSHSNGPKPELAPSESSEAAIAELGGLDNGKTDIPSEFDVDFWELMDSLDPLQSNETAENGGTNLSSVEEKVDEVEFSKWLRFLENELGLTSDDGVKANPQFQEMSFEPEIGTALFDYSSTWPCSPPHYLGI